MSVVTLIPNNNLCMDAADLAARVRALADRIEAGKYEGIERVIVLTNAASLGWEVFGRQCNTAELIGLLEYTKFFIMDEATA